MSERCKGTVKTFFVLAVAVLLLLVTLEISAKNNTYQPFFKSLTEFTDTIIPADTVSHISKLTVLPSDTAIRQNDSTKIIAADTLHLSKDSLTSPIEYSAEDSAVLIIPSKQFYLFGNAKTKNKDVELNAATIKYNQQTQTITAYGGTDTANNPLSKPKITQGGATSISDTINFNLKTQRGLSTNTYYNEGEIFVNAQKIKKVTKDVAYAYRARFTTCNLDTPHFDIRARKLKLINNKIAVSGPAFPEFEGVPIPIPIPFGIYPLERGRHSGLLPPQFTSNDGYGLGLENFGYYKVIDDYWDIISRGSIYSYGGWTADINPRYYKRYKYQGSFDISLQKTKLLNQGTVSADEFTEYSTFNINWTHSQNTKARPGTSFSASVHAGSTRYNQLVPNNPNQNYNNILNSSIAYSKMWDDGKYILALNANHTQNSVTRLVQVTLPTLNFTATTIYPFQKKEEIGSPKWYEKLGISYNGTLLNQFSFYDTAFSFKKLFDTAQWGVQHTIPVTMALPPLGPLIFSPSISYSERWYQQKMFITWNDATKRDTTTYQKGFYTARQITTGVSMNTRIFGTFNFPNSKSIVAIRHEIDPHIGISYSPDLVSQFYQTVQTDSFKTMETYSVLQNNVVGYYPNVKFGGITFGVDNLLEMKVRNKDTSQEPTRKIKLIDDIGINSAYNFFADSFQLSPFTINLRSTLFNKINITGLATLDPYQVDSAGKDLNEYLIKQGKIGRFTNASLSIGTHLQSKATDQRSDQERIPADQTMTPDEQQRELDYVRQNPAEFVDFNIPWTLQLSYSLNYTKIITTSVTSSLYLNGDFSLTPKWKIGGSTYYDFKSGNIQALSMFVTREMHCWQLAISINIGQFKSFSITLNPKSGILRDLKINRSRYFYNGNY